MLFALLLAVIAAFGQNSSLPAQNSSCTSSNQFSFEPASTSAYKVSNVPCIWNVSQKYSNLNATAKTARNLTLVLERACSDGYDITLDDSNHYEYITINKAQPVTIKGSVYQTENQMRTIWRVNTSSTNTITLKQGILTLQNIQFEYYKESNSIIYPTGNLLEANYFTHNEQLIITQCIFKGQHNISIREIIIASGLNTMNIIDCYFQDIQIENDFDCTVKFFSFNTGSEVLFENSHFENINQSGSYSMGIIDTTAYTDNQKVTINRCTFERCSLSQDQKQGLRGLVTGCIYGTFGCCLKLNFSGNQFLGNNKIRSQGGNDAYLVWYGYPSGWTNTNIQSKITQLFEGSTTTLGNSVYFAMNIDYIEIQSGYANITQKEICKSKANQTSDCVCDSTSTSYKLEVCLMDKLCKFDLIHQNITDCPCLSSADPRAGDTCPSYCVKGNLTSDCVCDSNSTSYSSPICEIDKKCKFDLINQFKSDCPCLNTNDPRAGGKCPAYCTAKDQPTTNCICDSNSTSYPQSTCNTEKGHCSASSNSTVPKDSCECTGTNSPSGCNCPTDSSLLVGIPKDRCECRSSSDPRASGICPAYCISKADQTSDCVCDTGSTSYNIEICLMDKLCKFDLIHQTITDCPCLSSADPRAGGICPAYCISKADQTSDCVCDTGSTSYLLKICLMDKLCKFDLIHQTITDCPCLSSADPRAGDTCPSYCEKGNLTSDCVCDSNSTSYSSPICEIDKKCKFDLINQFKSDCPCLNTNDPRAGGKCPAYCTAKDQPTTNCICDSNSTSYPQSTCNTEKGHCSASSNSTVPKDSCECTGTNSPSGCKCPTDPTLLVGIPNSRCECRSTADPRAGRGECPAYCVKGSLTPDCTCDIDSQSYPSTTCLKDKLCIFELISQSKANCPCLMKGDPRAGGICPSYCTSKAELTAECMCELGSSYPQATCERDKLCIVDLIHQSISNCPCLAINDPRGESICKQIEPSDPDPTDPIIPDPTEQDQETDQQQEGGSKQDYDDKAETIKEEQKSYNFVWIIIVVVGIKKQEEID
ncbi:MAG: hypothetical protein EZS28_006436 [Streblomastix strix]|uniref:CUB domain-containing protein n=1 Tax=Streblomastix strix TaxID=222440 RepID=A0A5J4WV28_9EUKA|nr:MAG: hypothetical protein EZS28_006436 [Streblomastix strix]